MQLIGGKNAKNTSSSTKRHFKVVMENKEHGLYVSSNPSSAAKKAVTKLCATDKKRKVEFSIREITNNSKKKTYGPSLGHIEKLKKPVELKGRVIWYKPVAKLIRKTGKKSMRGGNEHVVDELIQNPHGNYTIKVHRYVKNGPIIILLKTERASMQAEPTAMTYEESLEREFKTDIASCNYMITIDGEEFPVPEQKLSKFLTKNTESMGAMTANKNNTMLSRADATLQKLKETYPNFYEILHELNRGL